MAGVQIFSVGKTWHMPLGCMFSTLHTKEIRFEFPAAWDGSAKNIINARVLLNMFREHILKPSAFCIIRMSRSIGQDSFPIRIQYPQVLDFTLDFTEVYSRIIDT
jgi:hypothetical protein